MISYYIMYIHTYVDGAGIGIKERLDLHYPLAPALST